MNSYLLFYQDHEYIVAIGCNFVVKKDMLAKLQSAFCFFTQGGGGNFIFLILRKLGLNNKNKFFVKCWFENFLFVLFFQSHNGFQIKSEVQIYSKSRKTWYDGVVFQLLQENKMLVRYRMDNFLFKKKVKCDDNTMVRSKILAKVEMTEIAHSEEPPPWYSSLTENEKYSIKQCIIEDTFQDAANLIANSFELEIEEVESFITWWNNSHQIENIEPDVIEIVDIYI